MKKILSLLAVVAGLQACAHPDPMLPALTSSPDFAPVYPLVQDQTKPATGGIYGNRQSDAWFGRGRNYQVGDLITVMLNESTQAARSQGTDISKDASNTALPTAFSKFIGGVGANSPITGIDLNKSPPIPAPKSNTDLPLAQFCINVFLIALFSSRIVFNPKPFGEMINKSA
jgi:flagellar L-ring protein precursor FlgH